MTVIRSSVEHPEDSASPMTVIRSSVTDTTHRVTDDRNTVTKLPNTKNKEEGEGEVSFSYLPAVAVALPATATAAQTTTTPAAANYTANQPHPPTTETTASPTTPAPLAQVDAIAGRLIDYGVKPHIAGALVHNFDAAYIATWIDYAEDDATLYPGALVNRIKAGKPAPAVMVTASQPDDGQPDDGQRAPDAPELREIAAFSSKLSEDIARQRAEQQERAERRRADAERHRAEYAEAERIEKEQKAKEAEQRNRAAAAAAAERQLQDIAKRIAAAIGNQDAANRIADDFLKSTQDEHMRNMRLDMVTIQRNRTGAPLSLEQVAGILQCEPMKAAA